MILQRECSSARIRGSQRTRRLCLVAHGLLLALALLPSCGPFVEICIAYVRLVDATGSGGFCRANAEIVIMRIVPSEPPSFASHIGSDPCGAEDGFDACSCEFAAIDLGVFGKPLRVGTYEVSVSLGDDLSGVGTFELSDDCDTSFPAATIFLRER